MNNVKGASFTAEVLKDEIEKGNLIPQNIKLEHKYLENGDFAADIAIKDGDTYITIIDNKNWSKSFLESGIFNLNQAKEMIKTGKAKYNFRMREGLTDELVKKNFAKWLKKGANPYQNLKDIAEGAEDGFEKVFGKEFKYIKKELQDGNITSLDRFIELKTF